MERKDITLKGTIGAEGTLEAVFSTLETPDRDGDIIAAGAIPNGAEVPLVWSHDWQKIVGKGRTVVDGARAVFKGRFFLNTDAGRDAYETVKAMGRSMEYSWGFIVRKSERVERDGKTYRRITDVELLEVSPTLVGAMGRGLTGTLAIKSNDRPLSATERAEVQRITNAALVAEARDTLTRTTRPTPAAPLDPRAVVAEATRTLARTR